MNEYLKFITKMAIEDGEILLYPITSKDVYSKLNKELDEKYLFRIFMAFSCMEDFREKIEKLLDEVIELALNEEEPSWKDIDEMHKNSKQNL